MGNRFILMVLGVLTLASCFDQILVPGVESDGRLTVTNDPEVLSERLRYVEVDVPIDPVVPALFGGAAAPPTRASVKLTLTAELDPPTVDGQVVQATSISPPRRFAFAVSYNTKGNPFVGAVDYVVNPFGVTPTLLSSVVFSDSDVSAVGLDDDWIYAARRPARPDLPRPRPSSA